MKKVIFYFKFMKLNLWKRSFTVASVPVGKQLRLCPRGWSQVDWQVPTARVCNRDAYDHMLQVDHVMVGVVSASCRLVHGPNHVLWTDGSGGKQSVNIKRTNMLQHSLPTLSFSESENFVIPRGNDVVTARTAVNKYHYHKKAPIKKIYTIYKIII